MNSSKEIDINDMFRIVAEAAEVAGDNSFMDILDDESVGKGKNRSVMRGGAECNKKLKGIIKMIVYTIVASTLYTYGAFNPENIAKALNYIIDNASKLNFLDCKAPSVSMLKTGELNLCYILKKYIYVSKQAVVNHLNELHADIINEPDLKSGTSLVGTTWLAKTGLGYMKTAVSVMLSKLDVPVDNVSEKICDLITLLRTKEKSNNNNNDKKPAEVEATVAAAKRVTKKKAPPPPPREANAAVNSEASGGGNSGMNSEDYTLTNLFATVAEAAAATGDDTFEKLLTNPPSSLKNSNTAMSGGALRDICVKDSDVRKVFKYLIHSIVIYMFRARIYDFTTNGFIGALNAVSNLECVREPGTLCDVYGTFVEKVYRNIWKIVLGGAAGPAFITSEYTKKYLPGLDKALKELFDAVKKISTESTSGIREGFFLSVKVFIELDKELVDNVIDALCKLMSRNPGSVASASASAAEGGSRRRKNKHRRRTTKRN